MIGAGGQAGQGDAANLLKPALARGELRTIAATTWSEYKKYFEKDAALARRFQVVKVEEPTEAQAVVMMRGLVAHAREAPQGPHPRRGGRGRGAALAPLHLGPAAPRQGGQRARHRLRPGRARPDRDAARRRRLPAPDRPDRDRDRHPRARERSPAASTAERLEELAEREARRPKARLAELEARWEQERRLIEELRGIRDQARGPRHGRRRRMRLDAGRRAAVRRGGGASSQADLPRLNDELAKRPGREPADAGLRRRARRSPRSSRAGPASRSARWSTTRSRPSSSLKDRLEERDHRPVARARGDQPAHPDRAGQPGRTRAGRSASSCSSARAASARPRPRSRSPTSSTAASAT